MKRFCSVLVCVVFCLPLFLIPSIAVDVTLTDSSSLRSSNSSSDSFNCSFTVGSPDRYIHTLVIDGVEVLNSTYESHVSSYFGLLSFDTVHVISGTIWYTPGGSRDLMVVFDGSHVSTDSSVPLTIPYSDSVSFILNPKVVTISGSDFYFTVSSPDVSDFVSSGVGVVINSFGDVIDYVVNTPSVAVFVALSMSCALIPLGIVLVKKVIKGY